MKNQIAHITGRISVIAGLIAAFTLAPALSSFQSADAAPHGKSEKRFERRQDKREKRFERRQERREDRFERRNSSTTRWNNSRWNNRNNSNRRFPFNNVRNDRNRRYRMKYRTTYRYGRPVREYYRVYY